MIGFVFPHTHNSQLLLTDQRSLEKKIADAYVEQYRDAFPDLLKAFIGNAPLGESYDPVKHFPSGGTVTGRFSGGREAFPYIMPRGEAILPKDHPLVAADYGHIEARVLAATVRPKLMTFKVDTSHFEGALRRASKSTEGFAARMALHARSLSRLNDKMILLALFGDVNLDEPEPGFSYERRLAKLLKSRDPRQRKRGERLFNKWYRTRKGMNLYRGYSGK